MTNQLENITDLRDWLRLIDDFGELRQLDGAHWDEEIGAASQVNYLRPSPPALLFDNITGYRTGQRVLSASIANARRLGVTLRLGTDLDDRALIEALRSRPNHWAATAANYPTREVDSGPVCENILKPPELNLLDFPVPRWHEGDGGRYAGTGCAVFTTDPDTGVVNAGAYRMQVQNDGRAASVNMEAGKHGAAHIRAWFEREGRAPVTASLGHDPLLLVVAGTEVPGGVSELDYAGAVLGRPVDIVAGEVTGLPVPAYSEIVVEGWLTPDRREQEGPFGEWTGYYSGSTEPVLTMDIERIYHRHDPIQLGAPPGKPPHDYSYMRSVMKSAMIHDALVATGLPGLDGRVGARGRRRPSTARRRCAPAVPGARPPGGTAHLAAARSGLHEQIRGRRRPRRRPPQPQRRDVGGMHPHRSRRRHRSAPPHLGQPGRPAARTGRARVQQPSRHRRLPALGTAGGVPRSRRGVA